MTGMRSYIRHFNRTVLLLILSDLSTWGIYTVINALAGLYLSSRFGENTVQVIGGGVFVYFIARAIVHIPAGVVSDRIPGLRDEGLFLLLGNILMGIPFLFYPFISSSLYYYCLQAVFGVGAAFNLIAWRKIFASSLDKHREGEEYAVYDTVLSLFTACAGLFAGYIANTNALYFNYVIIFFGLVMISSSIWAVQYLHSLASAKTHESRS